jgi:hypothetical protein
MSDSDGQRGDEPTKNRGTMNRPENLEGARDLGGSRAQAHLHDEGDAIGTGGTGESGGIGSEGSSLLGALGRLAQGELEEAARAPPDGVYSLTRADQLRLVQRIQDANPLLRVAGQQPRRSPALIGGGSTAPTRLPEPVQTPRAGTMRAAEPRPHRQRPWALALGGLAVAAALVVGFTLPTEDRYPLPGYGVSATGGIKDYRGASPDSDDESVVATVQRVGADTELRVVCRPQSASAGPVTARTFVVRDAEVEEIRPKMRIAPTGAIEMTIAGRDLIGTGNGPEKLRIAIGRPDHASEIDPKSAVEGAGGTNTRWLTVPVELDGR